MRASATIIVVLRAPLGLAAGHRYGPSRPPIRPCRELLRLQPGTSEFAPEPDLRHRPPRHCSRVCLSGFRGSLMLTRVVQIQHLCYVRRFQRVLPVAIEASKPSAASLHQRPPHGSVALETARRRKVSNNHDAHPELGGSTKLSVTDNSLGGR